MTNNQIDDDTPARLNNEVLNLEQFEEMRDLLEDDFIELVQTYLADSQQRIDALRHAYDNDDNAAGFEIAHALTGASANIGTTQLVVLGQQIQQACRDNTLARHSACIDQIDAALQRARRAIHERLGL